MTARFGKSARAAYGGATDQPSTEKRQGVARKFLYIIATCIVIAVIGMIAFSFFGQRLIESAMIPRAAFSAPTPLPPNAYDKADTWFSRPDGRKDDPSLWSPQPGNAAKPAVTAPVFFVPSTSAFDTTRWNAPIDDANVRIYGERLLRIQASALASAGPVWAPRYRQAVFGAFLTNQSEAKKALDVAYGDVKAAFGAFLRANPSGPIVLAGHSQGSLHLMRLIAEEVAGRPVTTRVAAAYLVGWPVSIEADLPALALPGCTAPDQAGCILSWQSFATPADTAPVIKLFDRDPGLSGKSRKGTHMLCTNPLAGDSARGGALVGDGIEGKAELDATIRPNATCDAQGFLMMESAPEMGSAVLPGNNYHVYDYALFWPQIRADVRRRVDAWAKR